MTVTVSHFRSAKNNVYLVVSHVPIYTDRDKTFVTTDWKHSLRLLRDSLDGHFGPVHVLAPSIPLTAGGCEHTVEEMTLQHDGIRLIPSFDLRCRARHYWLRERQRWLASVRREMPEARVVHAGVDDVYRPIMFAGFLEALRHGKPTVFVEDTDIVRQQRELAAGQGFGPIVRARVYGAIYEKMVRFGVRHADLSLLKGTALMNRYGRYARNARSFQDTSHTIDDVIPEEELDQRRQRSNSGTQPLHAVYCGRLVPYKGVDRSIELIREAMRRGCEIRLDVIGDGPEAARLEALTESLGLRGNVRFMGPATYGAPLLERLRAYDALLFTPVAEDTPRMIFDGYAAGLPLIANDIAYVRERAELDGGTVLLPRNDPARSADILAELARQPARLTTLSVEARKAGLRNAAEAWYRRRSEWTIEAVSRREAGAGR